MMRLRPRSRVIKERIMMVLILLRLFNSLLLMPSKYLILGVFTVIAPHQHQTGMMMMMMHTIKRTM